MTRLLVVHHTPSPALQEMLEAVLSGARDDAIEGVEVVVRPALTASVIDVLAADGYLLGTPANLGYISGALKHFFDTIYYPCLEATKGRPFAAYVHGNLGVEGAVKAIETITTGLAWRLAAPVLAVSGAPTRADRDALTELGGTIAATVM
jgi:multimeric flavodoxin WrbA